MIYPGSTPELRAVDVDGEKIIQVRYVNIAQGYTSMWANLPVVDATQDIEEVRHDNTTG